MIPERDPLAILANLARQAPRDIDPLLFEAPQRGAVAEETAGPGFPPSPALWDRAEEDVSRIGVRIRQPLEQPDVLAARLAAIAVERRVHPVFLSYVAHCDMQRFGFRVEQLHGLTADTQMLFESQLVRFWRLALVIEASDIAHLG
jgi:hypothetical protein